MTGIDPSAAPPSGPARRILRLLSLPRAQSAGSYRPDIDGLRAVAVLSVLLYHLHLPMVPGGYVGVDIFFVISGFLITRNIWSEMGAGTFSVRAFYLRRIRRIAPAFLVMAAVTLIVGCLLLLPVDLKRLGAGTAAAAVSASNIFFWRTLDTGYFADSSEQEPLLHTWSLGVEEQFYLLWPATLLLLTVVLRGSRRTVIGSTLLILVASFAIGQLTLDGSPKFAYFMLPARAGELMVGALLALFTPREGEGPGLRERLEGVEGTVARVVPELVGVTGLGLIAWSLTQLNANSPFPGIDALPPSVGSVLTMLGGALGSKVVGRFLGSAPMVFVGLISYSLYLWHWPVLAYLRYFYTDLDVVQSALAVPVILALAILSYRFVELPARGWRPRPRVEVTRLFAAPVAALVAAGVLVVATDGLTPLIAGSPAFQAQLASATSQTLPALDFDYNCQLGGYKAKVLEDPVCVVGADGAPKPDTLLWGDSHAAHYLGVVASVAKAEGKAIRNASFSTCPPLLGGDWGSGSYRSGCGRFRADVEAALRAGMFKTVVLGGEWSSHDQVPGFRAAFETSVRTITSLGIRVVILGQVPIFDRYERDCAARALRLPLVDCAGLATEPDAGDLQVDGWLASLAQSIPGVGYLTVRDLLCHDGACRPFLDGAPVYFSVSHLSMDGSWRLGAAIVASPAEQAWANAIWGRSGG